MGTRADWRPEPLLPTKVISTSSSLTAVQRQLACKSFPLHNVRSPSLKAQSSESDLYCSQPASNQDDLSRPPLGIFSPYHRMEPALIACPLSPGHWARSEGTTILLTHYLRAACNRGRWTSSRGPRAELIFLDIAVNSQETGWR